MQTQSKAEYLKACSQYLQVLNKVNLLLVKEHTYLGEREQYEREIQLIDCYIGELEKGDNRMGMGIGVEKEHEYLQRVVGQNAVELQQLKRKLDTKEALITELNSLRQTQQKYLKLLSSEYQSSLQQKLSMIRGKVDDLKKKIKEINKDVLSLQQEHKEMMDDYSYRCNCLADYRGKNEAIRAEIEVLRGKVAEQRRVGFRY